MTIRQIGDWTLEDRLAVKGKSIVVLFLNSDDRRNDSLRGEFRRVAREHQDADFYEVDLLENPALSERYAIRQVPIVLVFIDGVEVGRHAGTLIAPTVDRILGPSPLDREDSGP